MKFSNLLEEEKKKKREKNRKRKNRKEITQGSLSYFVSAEQEFVAWPLEEEGTLVIHPKPNPTQPQTTTPLVLTLPSPQPIQPHAILIHVSDGFGTPMTTIHRKGALLSQRRRIIRIPREGGEYDV